ncbi:fibronectin type III domain-containing protein [Anoxybacteroides amylolyticum]|uniref:Fibronectin type III domain protein n=1 Tax=Anoxybacteroides amylolyticum TaxID=294699 RepID=A0A167T1G8_9BACL|nr:hypothetical protein [Anoxybacillus amylolyticus]ANB59299.1 fibronectin type III domain protein [Anoxybacillus amylolyticus]
MYKKIFSLFSLTLLSFFLIPASLHYVFAYSGGLLHGKTLNVGDWIRSINGTTTKATDGDESTSVNLMPRMAHIYATDTIWYKFTSPQSIESYQVKGGSSLVLRFFDSAGNIIYTSYVQADGIKHYITKVDNVYYASLENEDMWSGSTVYEFDVFGVEIKDTFPPSEVGNFTANVGKVPQTTIDLAFTNPSDIDFAGTKIYLNGVLNATLDKTKTSYSISNLQPNTNYNIKITTFDTSGNESNGVTKAVKTLSFSDITNLNLFPAAYSILAQWTNPSDQSFLVTIQPLHRKSLRDRVYFCSPCLY